MNLNLIKLLPVAIGVGAIGAGSASSIANTIPTHNTYKTNTSKIVPVPIWGRNVMDENNIAGILAAAPILDWKASNQISIVKRSVLNSDGLKINFVLNEQIYNRVSTATVSVAYTGQAYNINQWKCITHSKQTNAQISYQNWEDELHGLLVSSDKNQVQFFSDYWYYHQLNKGSNSQMVYDVVHDSAFGAWNCNVQNLRFKGIGITFTLHVFSPLMPFYWAINGTMKWDGNGHISASQSDPIGYWQKITY